MCYSCGVARFPVRIVHAQRGIDFNDNMILVRLGLSSSAATAR